MSDSENTEVPIEISPAILSEQALAGIIENFIFREGTDYGSVEVSYDEKVEQIRRQLRKGECKIVFDQTAQTVTILTDHDLKRLIEARQIIKRPCPEQGPQNLNFIKTDV